LHTGADLRAQHATTFLDAFGATVDARLQLLGDEATPEEERALARAAAALDRRSASLQTELNLLAQASAALEAAFGDDLLFAEQEDEALDNYADEAESQRQALDELIGTSSISAGLSNQLVKIDAAIERGNSETNSTPERARALSFALTKLRTVGKLVHRVFKAPLSLDGQAAAFAGREEGGQRVTITLNSNHTFTIPEHGDEPEETGTWSYERTGAKSATITLVSSEGTGALNLTFNSTSRGSFQGEDTDGEDVNGQFDITEAP